MRAFVPGFALLTLVCGTAATLANGAESNEQAGAAGDDSWTGHYEGRLDGGDGAVDIGRTTAGRYTVYMFIGELNRCSGELRGDGRVSGNRMVFTAPLPEQEPCEITLTRAGTRLNLNPSQSCSYFHGHSCALVGTVTRTSSRPQNMEGGDGRPGARSERRRGQPENPATAYAELVGATDEGGMPGCFDPSLKGRERAVAERLGGAPCGSATAVSTSGASWIAGDWVYDRGSCETVADLALDPDGTYHAEGEIGNWRLAGNTLTIVVRQVYEVLGEETTLRTPRTTSVRAERTRDGLRIHATNGQPSDLIRC